MVFDDKALLELRGKGADFKESFDIGPSLALSLHSMLTPTAGLDGYDRCPNIYLPEHHLPGFREGCQRFMDECRKLQTRALRALALGMPNPLPSNFFEEYHSEGDNQLRLLHCE